MPNFIILFLFTYLSGLIAVIFIDISWGIYLYELLYFLNPANRWWYTYLPYMRWSYILAIFIFLIFIIRRKKYTQNRLFDIPQAKWLIAIAVVIIAVYPLAVWPEMHFKALQNTIKLLMLLAILYKVIDSPYKFQRMIWAFLIGNFYLGITAHAIGRTSFGRLDGIGPVDGTDSNMTAAVMICAVPILLFYIIRGKFWQKIIVSIFLAYILDAIVLLNSRGGFLGLLSGIALFSFFTIFNRREKIANKIMLFGGVLFLVLLFVYMADHTFWERMFTLSEVYSGGGGSERIFFWIKGWEVAKENPFGLGTWGFLRISPQVLPVEMLDSTIKMRALHSTFISALVELGFLGFALFLCYLVSIYRLTRKIMRYSLSIGNIDMYYYITALGCSFVSFLTASVFIDRFYAELMYWIPAFIATFYNIYVLKEYEYSLSFFPEKTERLNP